MLQRNGKYKNMNGASRALRVALVGAGKMAGCHLQALSRVQIPHTVGAVYDPVLGRAEELARQASAKAYGSMGELLEGFRPDIVHVCTPTGRHFEPASEALRGGAHIYVEKPFTETGNEARALLELARQRHLLVCAGHQLTRDPAFEQLIAGARHLRPIVQVDSHFAFQPAGGPVHRVSRSAQASQLADVLPHPLYSLIAALEALGAGEENIQVTSLRTDPADVHAVLRAGGITGRLSVTLRGRPVASTLTATGEGGSLTADFVRSMVIGSANPGTGPLEKVLDPIVEGWQLGWRTAIAVLRRLRTGIDYPGLAELISAFYRAVVEGRQSPVEPRHLLRVTEVYEGLVANLSAASQRTTRSHPTPRPGAPAAAPAGPLAVLTGARGFLGSRIARHLAASGYRVRGISRSPDHDLPHVHEWLQADLAVGTPSEAFDGADVVIHAAAETSGGYDAHQRNSIDATRNLLRALRDSGVTRLVHVSSLSTLQPAALPWERLDEGTRLAQNPRRLGAYTWGKTLAEGVVTSSAGAHGVEARIIRPAALIDLSEPELPGLVGRRLFGRWHLGFGRPALPIAVCDVDRCAAVIAWCAIRFDQAPPVVNLVDPEITSRRDLLRAFRAKGWRGRMVWVPIGGIAAAYALVRSVMSIKGGASDKLAVWSILRPQRYDVSVSRSVLEVVRRDVSLPRIRVERQLTA